VRKPGSTFGTRREIKNLNSFKFMQQAIDFEVQWQIDLIEDGGTVQQATVLFNADTGETRAMRSKEDAHDYRYFPDPDLPPLVIAPEWIERVRSEMPELPRRMAQRFQSEYGLPVYDASMMTQSKAFAAYFEAAAKASGEPKLVANWLMGEVSRRLNAEGQTIADCPIGPEVLAELVSNIAGGVIHNNGARQLLERIWPARPQSPTEMPPGDSSVAMQTSAIVRRPVIGELIEKSVEEYRAGKDKAFNALVGQAMKASKGKANPTLVNERLKQKLG
jgi:aspartyl-tRNA(Asn)/glutamyl-tRNA(Gln) amidotransferase subunit B